MSPAYSTHFPTTTYQLLSLSPINHQHIPIRHSPLLGQGGNSNGWINDTGVSILFLLHCNYLTTAPNISVGYIYFIKSCIMDIYAIYSIHIMLYTPQTYIIYSIYVYMWHIIYIMPYTSHIWVHVFMPYTYIDDILPYNFIYICNLYNIHVYSTIN